MTAWKNTVKRGLEAASRSINAINEVLGFEAGVSSSPNTPLGRLESRYEFMGARNVYMPKSTYREWTDVFHVKPDALPPEVTEQDLSDFECQRYGQGFRIMARPGDVEVHIRHVLDSGD